MVKPFTDPAGVLRALGRYMLTGLAHLGSSHYAAWPVAEPYAAPELDAARPSASPERLVAHVGRS